LSEAIGKLFAKILIAGNLHVVNVRGLVRDEKFVFTPSPSTALRLARPVGRIKRIFGEESLIGAVFLDVAKVFDTVWVDGLFYKLTFLYFPSFTAHPPSGIRRSKRPSRRLGLVVETCGLG